MTKQRRRRVNGTLNATKYGKLYYISIYVHTRYAFINETAVPASGLSLLRTYHTRIITKIELGIEHLRSIYGLVYILVGSLFYGFSVPTSYRAWSIEYKELAGFINHLFADITVSLQTSWLSD